MGIFDLLSESKDRIDKNRRAREYIQRAKDLVNEGNELYRKAYGRARAYAAETEYILFKHAEYKKSLAKELDRTVKTTIKSFNKFDIDSKILPAMTYSDGTFDSNVFKNIVQGCIRDVDSLPFYDIFISESDYYEAKQQLSEAKVYKERMKFEREKLNSYKEKMAEIRLFVSTERNELDSLMTKIRKMNDDLREGMKKEKFSVDEVDYLKGINKIAECLVILLSTEFLNDEFSINQKYKNIFEKIKNMNDNLPYSPTISEHNTMNGIKRILDISVIY